MNFFERLYPYQKEAVSKCLEKDKGIIVLPTGTGKTFCQASIIADHIQRNPGFHIYVVNAPRIMLSFQLLREVYGFLVQAGFEARYMFVHSGGNSDEKELEDLRTNANSLYGTSIPFSQIASGTHPLAIRGMLDKGISQDLPVILFSTYNSADKIEIARSKINEDTGEEIYPKISIILNDEAHYLVQEQFHDILRILSSERCYFFTATTVHTPSDKGRGMNNLDLYGEIIYEMKPRRAIDLGKMIRPRLHFVTTSGVYNTDDYDKSLSKIIYEAFYQHSLTIKTKPRVLVSVKGTGDIKRFLESADYEIMRKRGVDVFAVASHEDIGNQINGEQVRRYDFLRALKSYNEDPEKSLLVLHYDVLSEGIDCSGFTGILPLRTLNKSKFLQTFGRAARVHPEDREKIDSGEINPEELNKMKKPYAWIIIPNVIHANEDDKENFISLIKELRDYGFKSSQDIVTSEIINGMPEIEELKGLNDINKRFPNIGILIEDLEAKIEEERVAKLPRAEWLYEVLKKIKKKDSDSN